MTRSCRCIGKLLFCRKQIGLRRENKRLAERPEKLIRSCRVPASNELFNDPITSSELLYAIQQLDFKKSLGPDGIHGQFIVNLGSWATKRLLHIFNLSWKLGDYLRQWKNCDCFSHSNVTFNEDLKVKFIKHEEHPELLRQLALEIINNIFPRTLVVYTDGSKSDSEEQVAEFL
ncbi:RNase H domain-containing protein [Caerostris extrusa]|uniref:RNase H domain-containing protein n=1 Tax=Caerostris extrusa TaxID=172846 RepID=A0AAV4MG36_CAEEX|nr:RNase H domain-containing protein [Caerostris extrusa]